MRSLILAASLTLASYSAHAVIIDTTIGQYDVSTTYTSFLDIQTELESQVWWGDQALADEFASLYAVNEPSQDGVRFAFDSPDLLNISLYETYLGTAVGPLSRTKLITWTYATATQVDPPVTVPEPGSLVLLGLGLAGLGFSRRKKA